MILTTDDNFQVVEYSKNLLQFMNMTQQQLNEHEEKLGKRVEMKDILMSFDILMFDNFGQGYQPPKESHSIVNAIVNLLSYEEDIE